MSGNGTAEMETPVSAEASLGVLLARLTEVGWAHETALGELAGRVEEPLGALADPDAVAEALTAERAEAARQMAEAEERAAQAAQAKPAAEAAARDAIRSRSEAEEAAEGAWEWAEALEADLSVVRQALDAARSDVAPEVQRPQDELAALRGDHAKQLDEARRQADAEIADAWDAARIAVEKAHAGRDCAEGIASELRTELAAAGTVGGRGAGCGAHGSGRGSRPVGGAVGQS